MNYLLRRSKRRYRNIRPNRELPRLLFHIAVSVILGSAVTIGTFAIAQQQLVLSNVSHLHRFIGTCFALFFSVLAIVLAFRNGASDRPISELKRVGLLKNIIQRNYLSVFVVGILYLFLTLMTVFGILSLSVPVTIPVTSDPQLNLINIGALAIMMFSLIFTMIRLASSFLIFYRLEVTLR